VLIVGPFPKNSTYLLGGVHKTCYLLSKSKFFDVFNVITFDSTNIGAKNRIFLFKIFLGLYNLINFLWQLFRNQPNSVVIFSSNNWGLVEKGLMAFFAKKIGTTVVFCPRASDQLAKGKFLKRLLKQLFCFVDLFVCQGDQVANALAAVFFVDSDKIKVIRNWTATDDLLSLGAKKLELEVVNNPCKIVFVGWLEKEKGILELVEAILALKQKRLNFKLWIVGDGTLRPKLESFCHRNNLTNEVIFTSWLAEYELNKIYKKCSIFVLPSWSEGMPNAMIEAMSTACVPVVTKVGNIGDLLNETNGVLVKTNDISDLIKKLHMLIDNTEIIKKISFESYKVAKENFSNINNIEEFIKAVKKPMKKDQK